MQDAHSDLFNRKILPRMPWHDVTFCVTGAAARDAAQHFIQRWDNHEKDQVYETMPDAEVALRDYVKETDHHANNCMHCSRYLPLLSD